MTENTDIRFNGWHLRVDTGELVRDGKVQRLTQQPLRILVELLRNPGQVVTRDRLVEVLWPKGVVDFDNGLNVAVRKLRLALGDESDTPRYIETLARRGYRFIGKIEAAAPPASQPAPAARASGRRTVWIIVGSGAAVAAAAVAWLATDRIPRSVVPNDISAPVVARRTTSVRAYEHYLQGIFHRSRRDADGIPQAIAAFEASLREDPEYAEAWAGLSDTYVGAGIGHSIPAAKAFSLAREAALRAVELNPALAEAHTSLGQIHMFHERDYAAAEREFSRAQSANEKYARLWHHLGMLRAFQGRPAESLAALRRARELEPMTLLFSTNHALVLYHSRRYDEAITHSRDLLATQPSLHQSRSVLIRSLVAKGMYAAAAEQLPLRNRETPNVSDAALVYAHLGQREQALSEIARIEAMSGQGFGVGYELAVAHAALGDKRAGCKALEVAEKDSSPFLGWMRLDPRMDSLRGEPCFAEIETRLGNGSGK